MDPHNHNQQQNTTIVSDKVFLVNNNNKSVEASLTLSTDGTLRWFDECLVVEKQVLGFSTVGRVITIKAIIKETSIKGDGRFCLGTTTTSTSKGRGSLVRKSFSFEAVSDYSLHNLSHKIQAYIDSLGRPKKLFIFLNPFGGKKSASKIFDNDVKPILEDANIEYTLQETKYQLHAKEVSGSLDLTKYDGIICVSGDGILVEVVNGLLERADWEVAMKMPLGAIPAGTGNGMIKSLLDSVGEPCTPAHAILAAVRGLIADIDIESEKYRWMGSARIEFYALKRVIRLRKYNGSICFVPAPGFEDVGEASNSCVGSVESLKARQHGYQGPKDDIQNLNWRKLNGPFISVWLHNVPWGAENTMAAPDAKFEDGYLDLIVIRKCPKLALISLMSKMDNGSHVKSPYVVYIKVKAVTLEPGPRMGDSMKEGIIDSDGEVLARGKGTYKSNLKSLMVYDKLQVVVDQGLATLFTPI